MKYISIQILQVVLIFSCISCKKFVEVNTPANQVSSTIVFETNETANAAVLSIYAQMVEANANPYNVAVASGLYTDELKNYSNVEPYIQLYGNSVSPQSNSVTNDIWSVAYNLIYQANAVIEGCQKSATLNTEVKKQIVAEALFIRAFWHFYTVNLFGNVPVNLTSDYQQTGTAQQINGSSAYQHLIADLKVAVADLKANYVDATGFNPTVEKQRPNKYAAEALLARVFLFNKKFPEAEAAATDILNQTGVYHLETLSNVFLANNAEAIWQLAKPLPNNANINTNEGNGFVLTTNPATNITGSTTVAPQLYAAFDSNDLRLLYWIGKYTDVSVTPDVVYFYPAKYKVKNGTALSEYSTVLRLAEIFLIRAEAKAEQGNLSGSIADVDIIRGRAGLDPVAIINPDITKSDLLNLILKERQRELFTEWGHRFLDMKRSKTIDAVMTPVALDKGSIWESYKKVWPIPQSDLLNNQNFKQNEGYN
jgi:starch-binding outer membrane protein, SusD/RagB family